LLENIGYPFGMIFPEESSCSLGNLRDDMLKAQQVWALDYLFDSLVKTLILRHDDCRCYPEHTGVANDAY